MGNNTSIGSETGLYDLANCKSKLASVTSDRNRNLASAISMSAELQTCQSDYRICENNIVAVNADLGTARAEIGTLNADLGTARAEIGTLDADLGTARAEIGTLNADLGTARVEIGTLSADLGTARAEIGTLNADLGTARADLGTASADLVTVNADLVAILADIATVNADLVAQKVITDECNVNLAVATQYAATSCGPGLVRIDGQCRVPANSHITCNDNFTLLLDEKTCAANCGANQNMDNLTGICSCNPGFTLLDDGKTCAANCGQFATIDKKTGSCFCPINYTLLAGGKNCVPSCVGNAIQDLISGSCACPVNYTLLNNRVSCGVNCGNNATLDLNTGVCKCPPNFTLLNDNKTCSPNCGINATINTTNGACFCQAGYTLLADKRNCATNCAANQIMDTNTGACSCLPGYTMLTSGTCAPNCGLNALMDTTTGVCKCKNNYSFMGDGKNCTLNCGQAKQLDPITDTCVCVAGFTQLTNGSCERNCGVNGIFNTTTGQCTCPAGYTIQADGRTCEDTMALYYPRLSQQLASTNLVFGPSYFAVVSTTGVGGMQIVRPYDSNLGFISLNANVTVELRDPVLRNDSIVGLKFGMLPYKDNPASSFYKVAFNDATITFRPFLDPIYPGKYGMRLSANTRTGVYTYDYAAGKWSVDEYSMFEVTMSVGRMLSGKDEITLTINGINAMGPIGVYMYRIPAGLWAGFTKFNFYNATLQTGDLCPVFATSNPAIFSQAYASSPSFFSCGGCDPVSTTCRFGICYPNYCVIGNDARPECGGQNNCPKGRVVTEYRGNYSCSLPHQCGGMLANCPSEQQCTTLNGINKCTLNGVPVDPSGSAYYPDEGIGGGGGGSSMAMGMFDTRRVVNVLEFAGYPPHIKKNTKT
jgi:hypothetical protein